MAFGGSHGRIGKIGGFSVLAECFHKRRYIFSRHQAAHQAGAAGTGAAHQNDVVGIYAADSVYRNMNGIAYIAQKLQSSAGKSFFTVRLKHMTG